MYSSRQAHQEASWDGIFNILLSHICNTLIVGAGGDLETLRDVQALSTLN
jgi:hypothetical protein